MTGDNFHIDVRSEGREHFAAAVRLAWANAPGGKATHYVSPLPESNCLECVGCGQRAVRKNKERVERPCPECGGSGKLPAQAAMVLLWNEDSVRGAKATKLPFPLTCEAAIEFLWSYLTTAEFGNEPDHDGSNRRGFVVTTGNFWGHVEGSHYAFIGAYPDWQMCGK